MIFVLKKPPSFLVGMFDQQFQGSILFNGRLDLQGIQKTNSLSLKSHFGSMGMLYLPIQE